MPPRNSKRIYVPAQAHALAKESCRGSPLSKFVANAILRSARMDAGFDVVRELEVLARRALEKLSPHELLRVAVHALLPSSDRLEVVKRLVLMGILSPEEVREALSFAPREELAKLGICTELPEACGEERSRPMISVERGREPPTPGQPPAEAIEALGEEGAGERRARQRRFPPRLR